KAKAAFDRAHAPFADGLAKFEHDQLPAKLAAWEKGQADKAKVPANIAAILKVPTEERKAEQKAELVKWYRTIDTEYKQLEQKVHEHLKKAPPIPKVLIATEGLTAVRLHTQGDDFLPETHFLRRGDVANKEGMAPQGFLQVLMPNADAEKRWQTP